MESQTVELRREELYERVWSMPMQRLSKEFGLSDVGLAKLCRRHQIPVPGRGYWRRLETGHQSDRPPLPARNETVHRMEIIRFFLRQNDANDGSSGLATSQNAQVQQLFKVLISDDRPISHRFAVRAKRLLSPAREDERGILIPEYGIFCPLKVSAKALPRALRLLDALLFALEQSSISLHWPDGKAEHLGVVVLDQNMSFSISEIVRQKPRVPETKKVKDDWFRPRKWDYDASGQLRLSIDNLYTINARHTWKDGKRQRVEDCLGQFIGGLAVLARMLKKQADQREREHRELLERCRCHEEERQRQADYFGKVEVLKKLATTWHECNLIREFVDKLILESLKHRHSDQEMIDIWAVVALANHYVRSADPIRHLPRCLKEFEQTRSPGARF